MRKVARTSLIWLYVFYWLTVGVSQSILVGQSQNGWTFFRGGDFDGHSAETGIVDQWPEKGPPVLWIKELGVGYSGFVGQAQRLYTQYQSLTGQFVVCLDATSGELIWKHRYGWPYKPASLYPGPRSTPTLSGNRLFFTSPTGELGCLDATTGKPIWNVALAKKFSAPIVEFGYACSPVCVDGKVILPVGGPNASMVALRESDGSVIWSAGNEKISYCSAFPIELEGRKLVVGYFKNSLCVFDREDGTPLGQVNVSVDYDEHSAWPIYREPLLWISGPFRAGSQLFELTANSESIRLKSIYKTDRMSNDVASSVLVKDELYGFDLRDVQSKVHRPSRGQFICMDFLTGKIHWKNGTLGRRKKLENGFVSSEYMGKESDVGHVSLIHADEKLILFNDTGELILCKADSNAFAQLARARILGGEICWVQPTLMNRCLFVRNHSQAVCVYLGDPAELDTPEDQLDFTSDLQHSKFVDLSAMVLGTEPIYAMTAPKFSWLIRWYLISLTVAWGIIPLLAIAAGKAFPWISVRAVFLFLGTSFGLIGTTAFGHWLQEFYFSWPIVLFIGFELVVCQLKGSKSRGMLHDASETLSAREATFKERPWLARLVLIGFVVTCMGYFWLCRRLSLAFEWTFLIGFPVALPFLWMVKKSVQLNQPFNLRQWIWGTVAFTAFYWAGAGIMLWKYPAG